MKEFLIDKCATYMAREWGRHAFDGTDGAQYWQQRYCMFVARMERTVLSSLLPCRAAATGKSLIQFLQVFLQFVARKGGLCDRF